MNGSSYDPMPGNYVMLSVRDTGCGMDKKTMGRIFGPFFTTKGLAIRTGLGLASTYGIIKAHRGYIDVDSERGRGTMFTIYLPATEQTIEDEKDLPGKLQKGTGTILVVDDEEMVLDAGERMLKRLGYDVLTAKSGQEALEIYEKNQDRIDMVLLDMIMPDMGGGKTYDILKGINPGVKVLLSSGYDIDGEATEILERGCDAFIQKPFDMEQLSQSVRDIMHKG
jgi:CheY-like chemotaxis protein